ncbi:MAG: MFS transporter [Betaproteobacteria bacterium]|nr:MFS transporter [Betaproteobacteria bacterium]
MAADYPAEQQAKSLVAALGVTQIIAWGSIYYLFALLIVPLERELAISRAATAGAFSLSLLASGLAAPWIGRLIDRVGGREVMTAGSIVGAGLLLALSKVQTVWMLYLVWAGLGVAMAATLYDAAFAVVTHAFTRNYRRAITTLTLFGGFASTVFWPLTAWLIDRVGWRDATLCWAILNLAVCAPLHWLFVPKRQTHLGEGAGSDHPGKDSPWLRNPAFLAFALSFVGQSLAISALGVHLLTMLAERGLSATEAAVVGAMIGPMQVAGRVLELAVSARLSAVQVGRWAVVLLPAALLVLLGAGVQWSWLVVFAVLYGAGNGAMTIVRGAAPAEMFGREQYGALTGAMAAPAMVARAGGPLLASLAWGFGGYPLVLGLLAVVAAFAAVTYYVATGQKGRTGGH